MNKQKVITNIEVVLDYSILILVVFTGIAGNAGMAIAGVAIYQIGQVRRNRVVGGTNVKS